MPNKSPLDKLTQLDVHEYWAHEAHDFTPWLADPANIMLLGEAIDLELEVQQTEQSVGPFKADIVCVDTATGRKVLIENQLEKTDHSHLGQILTYAAGLDAVVVVWIAARFTEEHRAALDWLNDLSNESVSFFGFEIELWRIGDSALAPKFNVVVRPHEWKPLPTGLTKTQLLYLDYWTVFANSVKEKKTPIRVTKPLPQAWTTFAIGKANFQLTATIRVQKRVMYGQLELYGDDRFAHFHLLERQKEEIESEIGRKLKWRELPDGKQCQIRWDFGETDPGNKSDWPRQHEEVLDLLSALHTVIAPRIKTLEASEWHDDEE